MTRPYNQLTTDESIILDEGIDDMMKHAKERGLKLANDDRCEEMADAVAVWIISSRSNDKLGQIIDIEA